MWLYIRVKADENLPTIRRLQSLQEEVLHVKAREEVQKHVEAMSRYSTLRELSQGIWCNVVLCVQCMRIKALRRIRVAALERVQIHLAQRELVSILQKKIEQNRHDEEMRQQEARRRKVFEEKTRARLEASIQLNHHHSNVSDCL